MCIGFLFFDVLTCVADNSRCAQLLDNFQLVSKDTTFQNLLFQRQGGSPFWQEPGITGLLCVRFALLSAPCACMLPVTGILL
jgi:hypothetical protein